MQSSDAMPPSDFPRQVIVLDKELATRHPDKAFYLRVQNEGVVEFITLGGSISPIDARQKAWALGYTPSHWTNAEGGALNRYDNARPTGFSPASKRKQSAKYVVGQLGANCKWEARTQNRYWAFEQALRSLTRINTSVLRLMRRDVELNKLADLQLISRLDETIRIFQIPATIMLKNFDGCLTDIGEMVPLEKYRT